jgi:hypothetical protein
MEFSLIFEAKRKTPSKNSRIFSETQCYNLRRLKNAFTTQKPKKLVAEWASNFFVETIQ